MVRAVVMRAASLDRWGPAGVKVGWGESVTSRRMVIKDLGVW